LVQTVVRKEWEAGFLSDYLVKTFPSAIVMHRVPVGDIPPAITLDFGVAVGSRIFRPSRPVADAIVIQDQVLYLIEGKIWDINTAIGQIIFYSRQLDYTPELSQYKDLPRRMQVVSARAPPWASGVHLFPEIEFIQHMTSDVKPYLEKKESYWTPAARADRQTRKDQMTAMGWTHPEV
jgi:hypothetical protein